MRFLTATGNQAVINQQMALTYLDKQQFYLHLFGVLFFVFLITFIATLVYSIRETTRVMYTKLIATLNRGQWSACGALDVALCIRYKWYNDVFGCGVYQNKNLPFALAMVVYNDALYKIVDKDPTSTLAAIANASITQNNSQYNTARDIVCKGLQCFCPSTDTAGCTKAGCGGDDSDLSHLCLKPCDMPPETGTSTGWAAVTGTMAGATGGMGFLFLRQMMQHGASSATEGTMSKAVGEAGGGEGAFLLAGVSTVIGGIASVAHNNIKKENAAAACKNQHRACFFPAGVSCPSP